MGRVRVGLKSINPMCWAKILPHPCPTTFGGREKLTWIKRDRAKLPSLNPSDLHNYLLLFLSLFQFLKF